MGKKLAWLGVLLTAVYLLLLFALLWHRWDAAKGLPLNELGDFLAGTFGPLAILWLVLGFFQQGIELRQNSAALRLQAEELKNSVEQQKQMVEVARQEHLATLRAIDLDGERLKHERDAEERASQPRLFFSGAKSIHSALGGPAWRVYLNNRGGACSELTLALSNSTKRLAIREPSIPHLATGASAEINFEGEPDVVSTLTIHFTDMKGRSRKELYTVATTGRHILVLGL